MPKVCATREIEWNTLRPNPVGRWSAGGEGITVSADEMDFKTASVRNLQVHITHQKKADRLVCFF